MKIGAFGIFMMCGCAMAQTPQVAGKPYTATKTCTYVKTLANGVKISNTITDTVARDTLGRVRYITSEAFGSNPTVYIRDPVTKTATRLDMLEKTASSWSEAPVVASTSSPVRQPRAYHYPKTTNSTQDPGTKMLEGLQVTGTRWTRTILTGEIGNDGPVEEIQENWYSAELGETISRQSSDPQRGDETEQMTNIVRAEPDPALFQIPADFEVLDSRRP